MSPAVLLLWGGALLTGLPVAILFLQIVFAFLPRRSLGGGTAAAWRLAVLVPAHNESSVIGDTLATIVPQLKAGDRVLVVADNCSDDTAAIARACGSEVVERANLTQRGKGFALDFGVRHLAVDPPDALVIVDADCLVSEGALACLAEVCLDRQRPVQALYLMNSPAGSSLKTRIAELAWCVKNQVRPLGWLALGWPCQLMGTGMAFPWAMASRMALANANIVEDMKLGIDLAMEGTPPLFCPQALVSSQFPIGEKATQSQRTRWEHGHLGMILQEFPRLLWHALKSVNASLLGMALDLFIPPLALLVLMMVATLMMTGLGALMLGVFEPFYLAGFSFMMFVCAIMFAWSGWGRGIVSLGELLSVPGYVLSKIPLYLGFAVRRQKDWVRTDRD